MFNNETDHVHIIHNSSEATERGSRLSFYTLGTTDNSNYSIEFTDEPKQEIGRFYTIEGQFKNNSNKHFTTVELNFSLLNKDGDKIGDVHAYCDGLNSNQTWKFVAGNSTVLEINERAVSAILDDVIYTTL